MPDKEVDCSQQEAILSEKSPLTTIQIVYNHLKKTSNIFIAGDLTFKVCKGVEADLKIDNKCITINTGFNKQSSSELTDPVLLIDKHQLRASIGYMKRKNHRDTLIAGILVVDFQLKTTRYTNLGEMISESLSLIDTHTFVTMGSGTLTSLYAIERRLLYIKPLNRQEIKIAMIPNHKGFKNIVYKTQVTKIANDHDPISMAGYMEGLNSIQNTTLYSQQTAFHELGFGGVNNIGNDLSMHVSIAGISETPSSSQSASKSASTTSTSSTTNTDTNTDTVPEDHSNKIKISKTVEDHIYLKMESPTQEVKFNGDQIFTVDSGNLLIVNSVDKEMYVYQIGNHEGKNSTIIKETHLSKQGFIYSAGHLSGYTILLYKRSASTASKGIYLTMVPDGKGIIAESKEMRITEDNVHIDMKISSSSIIVVYTKGGDDTDNTTTFLEFSIDVKNLIF